MQNNAKAMAMPTHIGFILDGNRRWAKEHNLPAFEGHRRGYERLQEIAEACFDRGIKYATAYVFSTENWKRTSEEVGFLMNMTLKVLKSDIKKLHEKNVRMRILGSRDGLDPKVVEAIDKAEDLTKDNTAGTLAVCFNYGGRAELVAAAAAIVSEGTDPDSITEETIKAHLYTHDMPSPDLIIRTSGEQRLSNFLLWDSAYAELLFVDEYWPDFDVPALDAAIAEYQSRSRRFGS